MEFLQRCVIALSLNHYVARLPNGMGVYIVSDPALQNSAMGVGVEVPFFVCICNVCCDGVAVGQVGSWSDPDDALGMAHFVEHMMFMGTKQHPKPGGFDDFLAQNGAQVSTSPLRILTP